MIQNKHATSSLLILCCLMLFLLAGCSAPAATQPEETTQKTETQPIVATLTAPAQPTPTNLPSATASPTAEPSSTPEPTATDTATPEPSPTEVPPVYVLLPAGAMVYPGPNASYPMLAALSEPITFTVAGANETGDWLVVNLSPYTTGWVEVDALAALPELAGLPVQVAPEGLPTVTPLAKPRLLLLVYTGTASGNITVDLKGGGSVIKQVKYPAVFFEVHTEQANTPFILRILNPNGSLFRRWNFKTNEQGVYIWTQQEEDFTDEGYVAEAVLGDETTVRAPVVIPK